MYAQLGGRKLRLSGFSIQDSSKRARVFFFFLLWPLFARAPRHWFLENFLLSAPGVQSVFFFVALRWAPRPFGGARAKKKHPGWCFFFLLRPCADAHSLIAGLGGDASPSPGWCFFLLRPHPDRGGVFFCCGPARTLTHSLWAGAISARPGWCFFFLLRPRRVFLDNNKKCLGYYIGSKKTRRGHSKKKKTPLPSKSQNRSLLSGGYRSLRSL